MTAVLMSNAPLAIAQWYTLRDYNSMTCCPPAVAVTGSWGLVMRDDATMKNGFATMQALLTDGGGAPGPTPIPSGSAPPGGGGGGPRPTPSAQGAVPN